MPTRAKNLKAIARNWLLNFNEELKKLDELCESHKKELEQLAEMHSLEIGLAIDRITEVYKYLDSNTKEIFKNDIKAKKSCKKKSKAAK